VNNVSAALLPKRGTELKSNNNRTTTAALTATMDFLERTYLMNDKATKMYAFMLDR
jgi:hypothetical protein